MAINWGAGATGAAGGAATGFTVAGPVGAVVGGALGFLGGGLGGRKREIPQLDPNNYAGQVYDDLSNPLRMLPVFQRLAASGTPTADTFLTAQAGAGGSRAIANEQFEAAQQRGNAMAFDAYQQYAAGSDRARLGAVDLMMRARQPMVEDYFGAQGNRRAFGAEALNLGSNVIQTVLANRTGGGTGFQAGNAPSIGYRPGQNFGGYRPSTVF